MKTKQERIEEMGKVIPEKIKDPLDNSRYIIFGKSLRREIARIYYNTGYRKETDTAREIFNKIFEVLCCFTTQGESKEYNEGYIDCLAEVDKILQNLAKEKYGVDVEE